MSRLKLFASLLQLQKVACGAFCPLAKGVTFAALVQLQKVACGALLAVGAVASAADAPQPIAIVIHGGAGVMPASEMTRDREAAYREGLNAALDAGYAVLDKGGSSLDAVTVAVKTMEDNPLFNAGRGAVLTHKGEAELDASIMEGKQLRAGAIAGVSHIKNPIELARLVMEKSPHVMLIGSGAEEFALEQGLVLVPNAYFVTPRRQEQLQRAIEKENAEKPVGTGTVGAVAVDRAGNLAAATSTGGMTNKRHGRVGDSPLIGAGTYANNASCAVSATGYGEYFIRAVVAHDICALVEYKKMPLDAAVNEVIHNKLPKLGGDGGVIAIDARGHTALDFSSEGMFRAQHRSDGKREVMIYRDR
jgi:beta-aspartyl-peptidase (threonine type)